MNNTGKRRGFLAIWIMLGMAALASVAGVLLYTAVHSVRAGASLENGLIAQYAAESGATWGLEAIKEKGLLSFETEFSMEDGVRCKVRIRDEGDGKALVAARGVSSTGAVRFITLHIHVSEGESRSVMVERIGYDQW